jgi:hypothetical protein
MASQNRKDKRHKTKNSEMNDAVLDIIKDNNLKKGIKIKRSKSKSDNSDDVYNELEKVCEQLLKDENSDNDSSESDTASKGSYKSKDL